MRRQISSKSDTCTESMVVYAAGISVKVGAHYPGRSINLPCDFVSINRQGPSPSTDGWCNIWTPVLSAVCIFCRRG